MKKSVPWTLLAFALVAAPAYAQSTGSLTPGAVQQQQNQTQRYYGQQKELQQGKKPLKPGEAVINKAKSATGKPPSKGGLTFLLRKVETNPSAILTSANVRKITAPYLGKKVTVGDLLKMVAEINELYKKKGYITARAFLPPQKVQGGVVHVELVEGRVARVTVTGNRHTRADYYTSRIGLKPGDLIRMKPLEKKLVTLNQTSTSHVRAVLQAGPRFGTTNVDLRATEPENLSTELSFDNSGYDSLGRQRMLPAVETGPTNTRLPTHHSVRDQLCQAHFLLDARIYELGVVNACSLRCSSTRCKHRLKKSISMA